MAKHMLCYPNGGKSHAKLFFQNNKVKAASDTEYVLGKYLNKGRYTTSFRLHGEETRILKLLHQLEALQIERFQFESDLLAGMNHQHLLKVYDVGEVETKFGVSVPFVVTEFLEGSLLGQVAKNGPLGLSVFFTFALQLCEATKHLHEQGIVHRDIKPGNLFYQSDRLVLGEFGLARTPDDDGSERFGRDESSNMIETTKPSGYKSPELIEYANGKEVVVDFRSDIFQIGSVLHFLLTGQQPSGEEEEFGDHSRAMFAKLIARCRSCDPEERFFSVDELIAELKAVQGEIENES